MELTTIILTDLNNQSQIVYFKYSNSYIMNKTIYFFIFSLLISPFVTAQEIINKIDLELPNNIKANDLISYDFNEKEQQYSLTFLKDLDSKKSTINVLTLNNDFEIIESSEHNLNDVKKENEGKRRIQIFSF